MSFGNANSVPLNTTLRTLTIIRTDLGPNASAALGSYRQYRVIVHVTDCEVVEDGQSFTLTPLLRANRRSLKGLLLSGNNFNRRVGDDLRLFLNERLYLTAT